LLTKLSKKEIIYLTLKVKLKKVISHHHRHSQGGPYLYLLKYCANFALLSWSFIVVPTLVFPPLVHTFIL